tara:strand:+ start:2536 stop:3216 length:681 start_codon:yes stop_codon:yes gene_type:complete
MNMNTFKKIFFVFYRDYLLNFRNFYEILNIFIFFILGILIFIFSIGPDYILYKEVGIGIIWSLVILSNNLSIQKLFKDDFEDGNLILYMINGFSFELLVIIKIFSSWLFYQLPFIIIITIACFILNIEIEKIYLILMTFLLSSPTLTCFSIISASMNLLNEKSFSIGGIMVLFLSIPLIIFSLGIINSSTEIMAAQINILIGIFLLFIAITPWIGSISIKIALRYQ